jgi:hypothetical protein
MRLRLGYRQLLRARLGDIEDGDHDPSVFKVEILKPLCVDDELAVSQARSSKAQVADPGGRGPRPRRREQGLQRRLAPLSGAELGQGSASHGRRVDVERLAERPAGADDD